MYNSVKDGKGLFYVGESENNYYDVDLFSKCGDCSFGLAVRVLLSFPC